jgi:hypothetical protein
MQGRPVTGGAEKELINYKGPKAKNQDSDHKFVKADRVGFFRRQVALIHIVCHGKSSISNSRTNLSASGECALIEINSPADNPRTQTAR